MVRKACQFVFNLMPFLTVKLKKKKILGEVIGMTPGIKEKTEIKLIL